MRKIFVTVLACIVLFIGYMHATKTVPQTPVPTAPVTKPDGTGVLIKKKPIRRSGVQTFMRKIARMESKNNPRAVNSIGMLGLYQFDPRTIRAMGFNVSKEEFLANRQLQDRVMLAFMKDNARSLRPLIKKYHGKTVNGIEVTKSGILGAAHLAGVGGVLSWFYPDKYQYKTGDSNGATVAMYMKRFGHINLSEL